MHPDAEHALAHEPLLQEAGEVGADARVSGDGVFRAGFVYEGGRHECLHATIPPKSGLGRFCGIFRPADGQLRSRDRISFRVILSDASVRPIPTPASISRDLVV